MNLRRLKWIAIIVPLGFLILLEVVRYLYLEPLLPYPTGHLLAIAVMIPAVYLFSHSIFTIITRMEQEVLRHNRHLAAMNQILTAVSRSLELDEILQVALDQVLEVMQIEMGAIALLDAEKEELKIAVNRGLPPEIYLHVKCLKPADAPLEWEVVRSGKPAVIENLMEDPRVLDIAKQAGFQSLVCLPLKSKGVVQGLLGIASCQKRSFSQSDVDLLMATGSQIGMTIENARLFAEARKQSERLRILQERERIAMDLHDGVIQSLYAVGLSLESCAEEVQEAPEEVTRKIDRAVDDLNDVIKDIRNYIFDLRPNPAGAKGIEEALEEAVKAFRVNSLMEAALITKEVKGLSQEEVIQLTHIVQEALINIMKHARASKAVVRLSSHGDRLVLSIKDNGAGFDPKAGEATGGQGLQNMARRAKALGGTLSIVSTRDGTEITVEIPLVETREGKQDERKANPSPDR